MLTWAWMGRSHLIPVYKIEPLEKDHGLVPGPVPVVRGGQAALVPQLDQAQRQRAAPAARLQMVSGAAFGSLIPCKCRLYTAIVNYGISTVYCNCIRTGRHLQSDLPGVVVCSAGCMPAASFSSMGAWLRHKKLCYLGCWYKGMSARSFGWLALQGIWPCNQCLDN